MSITTDEEKKIAAEISTLIDGDRITSFSDAIFAFAATLLVLKIDLPKIPPELVTTQFPVELSQLWPAYAANFISFLVIAYYWRLHHMLFIVIKRYDNALIWLNTLVLISVAFLPFPIDLFGEYSNVVPVIVFYTISLAMVGFLLWILWIYASHKHRLIDPKLSAQAIRYHTISNAIAPLVFLLSIPVAYYDHFIAKISWGFVIGLSLLLHFFYKPHLTKKTQSQLNVTEM